jgi:alpha-beta hydrolase superfamily lysophospholipase
MTQNSVAPDGLAVPLLIAQGSKDVIVSPAVTKRFVDRLCAARATVRYVPIAGGDHVSVAKSSVAVTTAWLRQRFADAPAPNDCGRL